MSEQQAAAVGATRPATPPSHDENDTGRISLATTRDDDEADRWNPLDLDDDPSFDSLHPLSTSTPQKAAFAARRRNNAPPPPLIVSSSEVSSDSEPERSNRALKLTRKRLANLTSTSSLSSVSASVSIQPPPSSATNGDHHQRVPTSGGIRNPKALSSPMYAPSPSTGSSTLVDPREDDLDFMARRRTKGKARARDDEEMTLRPSSARRGVSTLAEEGDDDEQRTATPNSRHGGDDEEEERSSSPRPPTNPTPRRRVGNLESYVQTHTSTTTPRHLRRAHAATTSTPSGTPLAPGAYPPTARRPTIRTLPIESTPATGRAQILDAFNRFIEGPNGALTLSAERRAALARKVAESGTATPSPRAPGPTSAIATPHPAGYYAFASSSASRRRRIADEEEEGEEAAMASPSVVARGASNSSSKSAKPHLVQGIARRRQEQQTRGHQYSEPTSEYHQRDRSKDRNPRTQEYEGDDSSSDIEDEEVGARARGGGRSAIEYAMAKSFVASPPPPPAAAPRISPPPRPITPPSPGLPDLPPMPPTPSPHSSPTGRRKQVPTFRSLLTRAPARSVSPPPAPVPAPVSSTPPRTVKFSPPSPHRTPSSRKSPSPRKPLHRVSPSKSPPHSPPSAPRSTVPTYSIPSDLFDRHEAFGSAEQDSDEVLRDLVDQLARLVHSRSVENSREEDEQESERPRIVQEAEEVLRKRSESERRGRDLDEEIEGLQREDELGIATNEQLLERLAETQAIDDTLAAKVDSLRFSLENMGQNLGAQVSLAVQSRLEEEARKRGNWFAIAVAFQVVLVWLVMCLANYRASRMYDSTFLDPFVHPALFYLSPSRASLLIPEETLAVFSPVPRRLGGGGGRWGVITEVAKNWVGQVVAHWGLAGEGGGLSRSRLSDRVPL